MYLHLLLMMMDDGRLLLSVHLLHRVMFGDGACIRLLELIATLLASIQRHDAVRMGVMVDSLSANRHNETR
jgi:hypothetical protein